MQNIWFDFDNLAKEEGMVGMPKSRKPGKLIEQVTTTIVVEDAGSRILYERTETSQCLEEGLSPEERKRFQKTLKLVRQLSREGRDVSLVSVLAQVDG